MTDSTKTAEQDALWRFQYRELRYLKFATADEIQERHDDIIRNAYFVARDGRLYSKGNYTRWMQLLAHILEEAALRKIELVREKIAPYRSALRAAELWDALDLQRGTYLLKFGKSEFMTPLYEKGLLQVSPASTYLDDKFNRAIRDDERKFVQESLGATVQFPPGRGYSIPREQWLSVPVVGTLKQITAYESECYMACFSMRYEYRLFDEFGYDACLVIRTPLRFLDMIKARSATVLPEWQFSAGRVFYRDPFYPSPSQDVLFSKHFRFAYEQEFRLVWEPPSKQESIKPILLELGALSGDCDLLVL
jgi:hypothetical protein